MTARQSYCEAKGCNGLPPRAHLEAHAHWGCTGPEHMAELIDAYRAEVLAEAGWVPCSPEWLATHPNECGTAPRLAGAPDLSHWHPAAEGVAAFAERAAAALLAVDPVEWALAGQHAGTDAAALIRRLAQPDTTTPKEH